MNSPPTMKLLAVVGATGIGKTKLAQAIAKQFNGVILSADSRQVYRGLDVGTNKEGETKNWGGQKARMIDGVPQLLIDIAEPGQPFTLNDWLTRARFALERIAGSDQLPIVVGGTGLYVTALTVGYQPGQGRYSQAKTSPNFQSLILMPKVQREELYRRSSERCLRIFDQLVAETRSLLAGGLKADWLINLGLDYRFATMFIVGQRDRQRAIEELQQASRQYIRRQLTWWRHHQPVVEVEDLGAAIDLVGRFLDR